MVTWKSRIRALEKTGLSLVEIGSEIGLSPQALCDIKHDRSSSPRADAALKLLRLHEERCPSKKPSRKSLEQRT